MCGRYAFDDIAEIYEVRVLLEEVSSNFGESVAQSVKKGEVFPTDCAVVLAQSADGYHVRVMSWGYPLYGGKKRIINARSETLSEKPMFRGSLASRKCLIPCTGFFEWDKKESGKQKYLIMPAEQHFFYLAGLYNTYRIDGCVEDCFVIITSPANEAMMKIHDRMPLIVRKKNINDWLNNNINAPIDKIYKDLQELSFIAV